MNYINKTSPYSLNVFKNSLIYYSDLKNVKYINDENQYIKQVMH